MSLPNIPYVRTPVERFEDIPDFHYEPHYWNHNGLRMAYIDEKNGSSGQQPSETFLCLHGQPTWAFVYRRMIPVLLNYSNNNISRRVLAPDLFGFGRSDKPTCDQDYTFHFHRDALLHFVEALDVRNITLVVQDWGGLLGLTLPIAEPARYKRLLVMNTTLGIGAKPTQGFLDWLAFTNRSPDMDVGAVIRRGTPHLSKAEVNAYNAPFPSMEYKAGVRRFPNLVMIGDDMDGVDISRRSLDMYKTQDLFGPNDVFMACGMKDPVLGPPVMKAVSKVWKNGCFYAEVEDAGHFVQEWGVGVAKMAIDSFELGRCGAVGVKRIEPGKSSL